MQNTIFNIFQYEILKCLPLLNKKWIETPFNSNDRASPYLLTLPFGKLRLISSSWCFVYIRNSRWLAPTGLAHALKPRPSHHSSLYLQSSTIAAELMVRYSWVLESIMKLEASWYSVYAPVTSTDIAWCGRWTLRSDLISCFFLFFSSPLLVQLSLRRFYHFIIIFLIHFHHRSRCLHIQPNATCHGRNHCPSTSSSKFSTWPFYTPSWLGWYHYVCGRRRRHGQIQRCK